MKNLKIFFLILMLFQACDKNQNKNVSLHEFSFDSRNFYLDNKPFQIIAGEMHYSRIPKIYWRHRIRMAKAMGCNTIATYVFWNFHEIEKGEFDFRTENKDLKKFIQIVQEEGMYLLFRPGPYSCGEWDLGGIPPYLLSIPDIKLRCMDERYISSVKSYINHIAKIIRPYQITKGGPIILLQIENEYGSFGNDRNYLVEIKKMWENNGINIPFYTADGGTPYMLEAGSVKGCAVGLDSGSKEKYYELARKINPGVPVFSSETYPGWLTHWREEWQRPDTTDLLNEVKFILDNNYSINFYMLHGGTNFGFTAGANSGGFGYQPDVTSYDYDAPIMENGNPREKYFSLRKLIQKYSKLKLPDLPEPIEMIEIPEIKMEKFTSVWDNLPKAIKSVQPKPFEYYNHYQGLVLYKTKLVGRKNGKLKITDLHDFATVFIDGEFIGTIDRSKGENSIIIPKTNTQYPSLEILVEAMGRINFGQELIDRKGITDRVTLNGMTLMNWEVYKLPLDSKYISSLNKKSKVGKASTKKGIFYKGTFKLDKVNGDTYFDMTKYKKGIVWINGHNLGRYWEIGPQHSLYCPKSWLKKGVNEILIFDLLQQEAVSVKGIKELI